MKIDKVKVNKNKVMVIGGVPQSVNGIPTGGYWPHMIPEGLEEKEELEVLILGVAGGTLARIVLEKCPKAKITGVDNNEEIIEWAKKNFDLKKIKMKILIENGYWFVKLTSQKFDLILVDMWDGFLFPIKSLSKGFIEDLKKILKPGGEVRINTPSLDFMAKESLAGLEAYRDDIGRNVIYRFKI
ncbi:MAG: spermidine synthase [Patescibacteria group bacterium]